MRVISLQSNPSLYSCNTYLILGDWNRLEDTNTLIDVGADGFILGEIAELPTGFGKKPVEQVVITHGHFDHDAGVKFVKERYGCLVMGFSEQRGFDQILREGQVIRCGDRDFEVIHTPGHSGDSVCLYCRQDEVLFSGDMPLTVKTAGGSYTEDYVQSLEKLVCRRISVVYPGHGVPIRRKVREMLKDTLQNVLKSQIIKS